MAKGPGDTPVHVVPCCPVHLFPLWRDHNGHLHCSRCKNNQTYAREQVRYRLFETGKVFPKEFRP